MENYYNGFRVQGLEGMEKKMELREWVVAATIEDPFLHSQLTKGKFGVGRL